MIHSLKPMRDESVWFEFARVVEAAPSQYVVECETGRIPAQKADGCLMAPGEGDQVLVALSGPGEAYILNILKRAHTSDPARIVLDGDTALQARGDLEFQARQVRVGATETVSLKTRAVDLSCLNGRVRFGELDLKGLRATWRVDGLCLLTRTLETVADRIHEKAKRVFRRIEEFEDTRAGRMRVWIKDHFSVQSKSASIKARERLKMDGDKILLG